MLDPHHSQLWRWAVGLAWPGPVGQDRADKVLLEAFESGFLGVERLPPGLAVPAVAWQLIEKRKLCTRETSG